MRCRKNPGLIDESAAASKVAVLKESNHGRPTALQTENSPNDSIECFPLSSFCLIKRIDKIKICQEPGDISEVFTVEFVDRG